MINGIIILISICNICVYCCIFMLQHIGYELPSCRMENDLLRLKAGQVLAPTSRALTGPCWESF
jgi:hypothetical protein